MRDKYIWSVNWQQVCIDEGEIQQSLDEKGKLLVEEHENVVRD